MDLLVTHRAVDAILAPLDLALITAPNASYTTEYNQTRAQENAVVYAQECSASGAAQVQAAVKEALRGKGLTTGRGRKSGGEENPYAGKREEAAAKRKAAQDRADAAAKKVKGSPGGKQVAVLADKTNGNSGKTCADKSVYITAVPGKRDRFTDDREATSKALAAEMGKWKTKDPCIYFHLNGSCSFTADTCRCYH